MNTAEAAHLLRRVGFGGTTAEINHFRAMTREQAVAEIVSLNPPEPGLPSWIDTTEWWTRISDLRWWWANRMVDARWVDRAGGTPSPLVEKLSLFWHGHFATGVEKVGDLSAIAHQNQLFRRYGMGDFETLLRHVTTGTPSGAGALLVYLDNHTNNRWNPQENFARELMELYTIGPTEFSEADVIDMARAWTGHGVVGWVGYPDSTYVFRPDHHDDDPKTLFGITRNWDGPETVTELVKGSKRDATARFLANKLWRFFVNDSPSEEVLDDLVAAFTPTMRIRVLLEAILLHDEFWNSRWALVRSPTEFVIDLLRRTGLTPQESNLQWIMDRMGQSWFEPPSVAGWGTSGYWVSTMDAYGRADFVNHLRWNPTVVAKFATIMDEPDATAGANRIISVLGLREVSTETRSALETWWSTHAGFNTWAGKHNAIVVGALTPEFLAC